MQRMLALLLMHVLLTESATGADPSTSPENVGPQLTSRSVYRISVAADSAVTGAAVLGIAIPYSLSSEIIKPRCPCNPGEVNAFDRPTIGNHNAVLDTTSDVTVGVVWVLPVLGDVLDLGWTRALGEDMVVYSEVLAVNGALVTAAKYIIQRPLPRTYAGDPRLIRSPGGYRSFYSGHTSNIMASLSAAAMTLRLRYGERWWPWVVAVALGSAVAFERVEAGRHFPTDVITGGAMGTAVGIVLPLLHEAPSSTASGASLEFGSLRAPVSFALHW